MGLINPSSCYSGKGVGQLEIMMERDGEEKDAAILLNSLIKGAGCSVSIVGA